MEFTKNNIYLILCLLCSVHFFGLYHVASDRLYDLIDLVYYILIGLVFLGLFYSGAKLAVSKQEKVGLLLLFLFFFSLFISVLSCYFYHGQAMHLTIVAMRGFSYFLVFPLLLVLRPTLQTIERIIVVGFIIYALVFLLQVFLFPIEIVPLGRIEGLDRGLLRVRVEGVGFATLGGLIGLFKYFKYGEVKWAVIYIISLVMVFMLGFRTLLFTYFLASFLLVLLSSDVARARKILVVFSAVIFSLVLYFSGVLDRYIEAVSDRTIEQIELGDDYIRIQTFRFLFDEVSTAGALLFGNGMASEHSLYGDLVLRQGVDMYGYISADLGLLGFLFHYGFFGLLAFLAIYLYGLFCKGWGESTPYKIFFIYLIVSSFTTAEIFRAGMYGIQMMALYFIFSNERRSYES